MYVEYSSNNSGGHWWLKDEHWHALEKAGWIVKWNTLGNLYTESGREVVRNPDGTPKLIPIAELPDDKVHEFQKRFAEPDGRWLGSLAKYAYRVGLPLREAADEWERVTGQSATDAGCPCCGQPHDFTEYDDAGKYVKSGPETSYTASW